MLDSIIRYFILIVPIFMMILGTILLIFWIKQKKLHSIFWFSLTMLLHGLAFLIQISIQFNNLHYWYMLLALLYYAAFVTLAQSVSICFDTHISWRLSLMVLILLEVFIFYFSFISENFLLRIIALNLGVTIILFHCLPTIIKSTNKNIFHKLLKWIFIFVITAILVRVAALFKLLITSNYFFLDFTSNIYWFITQISTLILTMLFASLLIAINIKEILNIHQLEIENIKLQERLQISHDLHDVLGSSLVRSISMLSQNTENMDNQKFLSMLKILRDDLRQIMDNNTNMATEIPQTPIFWGAPVRHRFSQIFTELNIHAKWDFATEWQAEPNALECLTLLRVTEEALTNIIKHSQAKQVSVRLYYAEPTQLMLEIEDDGIGFDIEVIKQSNHSIGMRSMQIRLEKINASMHIQSHHGQTLIQVIKIF